MRRLWQVRGLAMLMVAAGLTIFGETAGAAPVEIDLDEALQERVLGAPDAPVTMAEYSSLTCPHCADFHNKILPALKTEYIDTGKVKLVYRDFPHDRLALFAAILSRCAPPKRFFGFLDVLYRDQRQWMDLSDSIEALRRVGKLGGVNEERFDACVANEALFKGLLEIRLRGINEFKVDVTPTFIFNDGAERVVGAQPVENFRAVIERLLAANGRVPAALQLPVTPPAAAMPGTVEEGERPKSEGSGGVPLPLQGRTDEAGGPAPAGAPAAPEAAGPAAAGIKAPAE